MKIFNGVKKNQIIVLIIVLVLIFGGILGRALLQKAQISLEEAVPEEIVAEEVFSFTGIVSEVNVENNFLTVMPMDKESEVKVIIGEDTKLFKIVYSSEGNPEFVTERTEITVEDIGRGDHVFVKTGTSIVGKEIINDVEYIEVL